jgi:chloramphenicol-sensitive protein RarD
MEKPGVKSCRSRYVIERKTLVLALTSYFLWGFFPIYWKFLKDLQSFEILAHRFIWSFVFYLLVFLAFSAGTKVIRRRPIQIRDWLAATLASLLLAINWGSYIYGVNSGQILETSMAYFLNPLLNVAVGVLVFREPFPWPLKVAVSLASLGVMTLMWGTVPWLALVLASTFCAYGVVKKTFPLEARLGSVMEGFVALFPAVIAAVYFRHQSPVETLAMSHWLLFMGAGVVTGLPLVLFSYSAQKLPYSLMGVMQFIAPTLQFLVGLLIFGEKLTSAQAIAFVLVWTGIGFYLAEKIWKLRA